MSKLKVQGSESTQLEAVAMASVWISTLLLRNEELGPMVEFTAADPVGPVPHIHPHIQNTLTCIMEIH